MRKWTNHREHYIWKGTQSWLACGWPKSNQYPFLDAYWNKKCNSYIAFDSLRFTKEKTNYQRFLFFRSFSMLHQPSSSSSLSFSLYSLFSLILDLLDLLLILLPFDILISFPFKNFAFVLFLVDLWVLFPVFLLFCLFSRHSFGSGNAIGVIWGVISTGFILIRARSKSIVSSSYLLWRKTLSGNRSTWGFLFEKSLLNSVVQCWKEETAAWGLIDV